MLKARKVGKVDQVGERQERVNVGKAGKLGLPAAAGFNVQGSELLWQGSKF